MKRSVRLLVFVVTSISFWLSPPAVSAGLFGRDKPTNKGIEERKKQLSEDVTTLNRDIANLAAKDISLEEMKTRCKALMQRANEIAKRQSDLASDLESVVGKYRKEDQPHVRSYIVELRAAAVDARLSAAAVGAKLEELSRK